VYRNAWLRLREDEVERSNGVRGIYGVVDKDECAIILPIQGETIYLIEQFRYTVQERCLELPQGGWETAGVDPEELAVAEGPSLASMLTARQLTKMQIASVAALIGLLLGQVFAPDASIEPLGVHSQSPTAAQMIRRLPWSPREKFVQAFIPSVHRPATHPKE